MKRWFTTIAAVLFCSAALRADVTLVQTTTIEGGMASMAAASGAGVTPKLTTRIKGMKSRTDMEAGAINVITIVDVAGKQMIVLRPDQKTATIVSLTPPPPGTPQVTGPTVDGSIKATGKSQTIDGVKCDEYSFTTNMDMSAMGGGQQVPPEAAAAMQGIKMAMVGSLWVAKDAPGVGEYVAFQKSSGASMAGAAMGSTGMNIPGMDKMMKAMSAANGLPYLTEMTINIDGTGQIADMMRQMGPMKVTTKVNSISTESIADDLFKVPEGYTIVKQ